MFGDRFFLFAPDDGAGSAGSGADQGDQDHSDKDESGSAGQQQQQNAGGDDSADGKLRAARKDAASWRKRAEAAETQLSAAADAQKTDLQRLTDENTQLRDQGSATSAALQDLRVENAVLKAAASVGLIDPDAAVRMLDRSDLTFDDDGNLDQESVANALNALVEAKPYLKARPGSVDGGAQDHGGNVISWSDAIKEAALKNRRGGTIG